MKNKIALLIVLCMSFTVILGVTGLNSKSVQAASFEKVGFVNAAVTAASGLNVRTGPSTNYKVICVLKSGQKVKVFGQLGNWYAVYDPATGNIGAAFSKYLKTVTDVPASKTNPEPTPAPEQKEKIDVSDDEEKLLSLVNNARNEAGSAPLKFDQDLVKLARLKAKDMVDNNYFSHTSNKYGSTFDMMKQFNISYRSAGENIAGNRSIEGAFKAWSDSDDHKRNIINNNFNYTGIGIIDSPTYGKILVQMFIKK